MTKHSSKYIYFAFLLIILFSVTIWFLQNENEKTRETIEQATSSHKIDAIQEGVEKAGKETRSIIQDIAGIIRGENTETREESGGEKTSPIWQDEHDTSAETTNSRSIVQILREVTNKTIETIDDTALEALKLSDAEEREIGQELFKQVIQNVEVLDSPELLTKLHQLSEPILRLRRRKAIRYRITVIDDDNFSAFVLPGGYIFISTGVLRDCKSDDEVTLVLAHEISHVDLRHCAELVTYYFRSQKIAGRELGTLTGMAYQLIALGYSEQKEFEADANGLRLLVASGRNPNKAILLFDRLIAFEKNMGIEHKRPEPSNILDEIRVSIQDHFRSHPPTEERKQRLVRLAKQLNR
jgi:beta-barrel assembly-enhancing protease